MSAAEPDDRTSAHAGRTDEARDTRADALLTSSDAPSTTFSGLVSKVLDQLSASSWLPAAMLTLNAAVLLQFCRMRSVDLLAAVSALAADSVQFAIVFGLALVLATMITQAFEPGAIRFLQGNTWCAGPLAPWARWRMVHHERRRDRLRRERDAIDLEMFQRTWPVLQHDGWPVPLIVTIATIVSGGPQGDLDEKLLTTAVKSGWREMAPSHLVARWQILHAQSREYPYDRPIYPTRIGNLLRVLAQDLKQCQMPVNFVTLYESRLPPRMHLHYIVAKNRLDMHCMLVVVFTLLAIGSLGLLWARGIHHEQAAAITGGYLIMAWIGYEAAVRVTRHYMHVTRTIAEYLRDDRPPTVSESR